ncbi:hypothetical protein GOBAR_AA22518 [Gossypium barbadense]|uniref:Uncharacterized protein n=1 Tax=Gossypium barbadense TaxID=3634 RepID=A0A2P5X495_GOSBA|nr:hypothetical protein GOBAR_AA22518 [Gossypium barbadense]
MKNNQPRAMIRFEEDTPMVVEVGFHNHSVHRIGYRGGWAGHGSRGEPFPMECQAQKGSLRVNYEGRLLWSEWVKPKCLYHLDISNQMNNQPRAMIRFEEDTPMVVEVGFHNHSVHRIGYRGGWAGHGSRGEPFPMECQVPKRW